MKATLIDTVGVGNTLGEGVLWDDQSGRVLWTDIQERRLYRYEPKKRELDQFELPERLGSFGFVQGSERLVCAFESGFAFYQPESGELEWIERPTHAATNVRFNDGRVDRRGRFWAGSMVEGSGEPHGKLYSLDRGRLQIHLTGIAICNSVCFSPDERHTYFADTPHRTIWRFDSHADSGALSNRTVFAQTPRGAYPDGSNVDQEGRVWNAHWGGGRVVCYATDGAESGSIDLPITQPSCVAFGGEDFHWLFVTTARQDLKPEELARQPHAGDLFVYEVEAQGLAEPRYRAA
jgi:sugar lactone lactonase YvrE